MRPLFSVGLDTEAVLSKRGNVRYFVSYCLTHEVFCILVQENRIEP